MVLNMLSGGAAVSVMCRQAGVEYKVVDMGVASDFADHEKLLKHKVAPGTRSFLHGSAMTPEECCRAVDAGRLVAIELNCDIAAIGEMGIGNTSSASALVALVLGVDGSTAVGRGTGAEGELLDRKRRVIHEAVKFHRLQSEGSPMEAQVGGFEIAGMVGFIFGCAQRRIPVVVDGFIATAAALVASEDQPSVKDYLFWGHVSEEQFHRSVLEKLGARPILQLGMRLGEGTGAVLALQVIEQALNCYHLMATFSSAGVSNRD
jgi:nicotinate-nucleotide--dimethylbenzimidazole phosphoribosyltransferase